MSFSLAVLNIQRLAASAYSRKTMTPQRRWRAAIGQISVINHQEVHDGIIAAALCDIHHCPAIRLQTIERRAAALYQGVR
jgi:hypothetical protein